MFADHSVFETGLDSYEGLPPNASNITVYRNSNISGVFLTDFAISEAQFIQFAAENNWGVEQLSDPVSVFHATAFHQGQPNDKKIISNGLYYCKHAANGGGVTIAFDRSIGRAYIESSSR